MGEEASEWQTCEDFDANVQMLNNPTDTHSYTQKPQYITSLSGCSWSSGCSLFNGLHLEIHHVWVRRTGYPDHIRWCVCVCGGWGGGGGLCACVNVTIFPDICHNFVNIPAATCSETDVCVASCAMPAPAQPNKCIFFYCFSTVHQLKVDFSGCTVWLYNVVYFGSWVAQS